jgi:hypothetical protein
MQQRQGKKGRKQKRGSRENVRVWAKEQKTNHEKERAVQSAKKRVELGPRKGRICAQGSARNGGRNSVECRPQWSRVAARPTRTALENEETQREWAAKDGDGRQIGGCIAGGTSKKKTPPSEGDLTPAANGKRRDGTKRAKTTGLRSGRCFSGGVIFCCLLEGVAVASRRSSRKCAAADQWGRGGGRGRWVDRQRRQRQRTTIRDATAGSSNSGS